MRKAAVSIVASILLFAGCQIGDGQQAGPAGPVTEGDPPAEGFAFMQPRAGDVYRAGDTLEVIVRADPAHEYGGVFEFSIDGRNWIVMNSDTGQVAMNADPFRFTYVIPETVVHKIWDAATFSTIYDTVSTVSNTCSIHLYEYNNTSIQTFSDIFSVIE